MLVEEEEVEEDEVFASNYILKSRTYYCLKNCYKNWNSLKISGSKHQ
jgi:hypothetical protein